MAIALQVKAIKPSKLKVKELRLELLNEMRKAAKEMRKDFEATTKTWEHKPEFQEVISLAGSGPSTLVGTDDEIYGYVNSGTKPHIIRPKKARALHFMGTYKAKTVIGSIGSRAGGSSGAEVFSQGVHHPGTKARKFDELIYKKWRKPYLRRMEDAMKRAAQKSGHSI